MNVLSITGLDANQVAPIVKGLQQLLADFQVYYANLRGYHWHVRGPQFFTLHSQFEKMYDEAAESVDEIAERILQLGATPENRFSEYLKISQLKEQSNVSAASDIISAILESLRVLTPRSVPSSPWLTKLAIRLPATSSLTSSTVRKRPLGW